MLGDEWFAAYTWRQKMQGFENTRPEYAGPEFVGPNVGAGKK